MRKLVVPNPGGSIGLGSEPFTVESDTNSRQWHQDGIESFHSLLASSVLENWLLVLKIKTYILCGRSIIGMVYRSFPRPRRGK